MSTDAYDQFKLLIREQVSPRVHDLTLPEDDIAWQLIGTFEPETLAGRDPDGYAGYAAEWRVRVQRAGRVSGGSFKGNTLNMMGKGNDLPMGHTATKTFLDPNKTPLRAHLKVKMMLKRILGSLTINRSQIMADLATNPIEEVAGDHVEDAVYQARSLITNYFWGDGSGAIAKAGNTTTVTEADGGVELQIAEGTPFRFVKGARYQFASPVAPASYRSAAFGLREGAGAGGGSGAVRCVNVDVETRTVWFESEPGVGNISVTAGDVILLDGTYDFNQTAVFAADENDSGSLAANGIHGLLLTSGVFPGTNYNVSNYSELKSWVEGDYDNPELPTPELVAKLVDRITDSGLQPPSAVIAEQSIWTLWSQYERQAGASYMVPQGALFQANGGVTQGPNVGHGNHSFARLSSARCRPNTIYGVSPDTFKKFMPLGDRSIRWVYADGPLSGHGSIFGPVYEGNRLTELADAPFEAFCQFGMEDPKRNFIIQGVRNQRDL